jgi:hypothetical protein
MKKLVIGEAPEAFDAQFLNWLRHWEDQLSVRLADWVPSSSGKVQRYADTVQQVVPADLQFYYEHAYPFGLLRDGWNSWHARIEGYHIAWVRSMVDRLAMESTHAEALVATSPPLWPIYCLEQKRDVAGFVWQDRIIAVMELDLAEGGRGRPVAVSLRNYFLTNIALELLAEDEGKITLDELRQHPEVLDASGWPTQPPFPEHIALVIDERLR